MSSTFAPVSSGLELTLRDVLVLDVVGAFIVRHVYKRHEIAPSRLGLTFLLLGFVPSLSALLLIQKCLTPFFLGTLLAFGVFYAILIGSVMLYRLSPFHPLAQYPGPLLPRVTKLYGLLKMVGGKNHEWYKKLHDKYGPYVRIGPNEISVVDVDTINSVLGSNSLPKGPMWDGRRNSRISTRSVVSIRDLHEHARRRRPWNRAFNTASLKGYEPTLTRRVLQLAGELERRAQNKKNPEEPAVDLAHWIKCFTFDFMGDMAFSESFQMMREGGDNIGIWPALELGMKTIGLIHNMPWLLELFDRLFIRNSIDHLRQFAVAAVTKRKQEGSHSNDIFHHLIDEDGVEKSQPTDIEVLSDATTTVVAGSDTTSTVLSGLFYNLLQHPEDYRRLQEEVDQTFPPGGGDAVDVSKLSEMVFLNAVINEALRYSPAVNAMQRGATAATGDRHFGNNYIPEGTAIGVPLYTLFRDPRYFSPAPDKFWPDRWLESSMRKRLPPAGGGGQEKEVLNLSAFIPFSYGAANCAGRSLALMEMRMVVALLMQRFEVRLDAKYDPKEWYDKYEDWFVFAIGRLPVVLTARN